MSILIPNLSLVKATHELSSKIFDSYSSREKTHREKRETSQKMLFPIFFCQIDGLPLSRLAFLDSFENGTLTTRHTKRIGSTCAGCRYGMCRRVDAIASGGSGCCGRSSEMTLK